MSVKAKEAPSTKKSNDNGTLFVCTVKPEAKAVYLVGEFNNWDCEAHRMVKRQGKFQKKLQLKPGAYQYKFLVDGEWRVDPKEEQVRNEFGTMNNIVRV